MVVWYWVLENILGGGEMVINKARGGVGERIAQENSQAPYCLFRYNASNFKIMFPSEKLESR